MPPLAILAGGLATRLRPLTGTLPKSLVPINGEPFIGHQLRLIRDRAVERVVLCVGHGGAMIQDFVGDGSSFGLDVQYSWDGERPLGTAGAAHRALGLLGEEFLLLYGDSYLACDYGTAVEAFRREGRQGLVTVFRNDGRWDTSNVEFRDGRIAAYAKGVRNPRMRHIDYGLGVFRSTAFEGITEFPCDLTRIYQQLLEKNELAALEVNERFFEAGSFAGIAELENRLKKGIGAS